jgi:hypothetical protein
MPGKEAIKLVILIVASAVALLYFNYVYLSDPSVVTAVSFQGSSQESIFDGALVVNIQPGSVQSSQTFVVYSQSTDISNVQLSFSDLYETNSGKRITLPKILPQDTAQSTNVIPEGTEIFSFSTESANLPGLYQGSLFVKNETNSASLPIVFDVKPPLTKPMIIVVDGIALSIILWKLIAYFNSRFSPMEVDPDEVPRLKQMMNPRMARYTEMRQKGAVKYAVSGSVLAKNLILDIGTIIFGIGLALIGLPANEAILNVRTISDLDIWTLLGIGLGIGSLKEFLSRS